MSQTGLVPVSDPALLSDRQKTLIRAHLDQALAHAIFAGSKRTKDFLSLVVGRALEGRQDSLHERTIGAELFGRPIGYDTGNDSVVRVRASDARKKLALYYSQMPGSTLRIELPSGSYIPVFHFLAEESTPPAPASASPLPEKPDTASLPLVFTRKKRENWPLILLALLAVALLAGFSISLWQRVRIKSGIHAIAVLPLENLSGSPTQEYFADGITEELINNLGQASTLRVTSLTSSMSYKGTKKKLPDIAQELGVDAIIEGGLIREGDQLRISTQLIDARTDRPIWARTYLRQLSAGGDWQGEVAQDIVEEISLKVNPQAQTRRSHRHTAAPDVQDLYLHGISLRDAGNCPQAIPYFEQAIARDANDAEPHSALASCYGMLGESGRLPYLEAFTKQKAEAQRAIALDDTLSESHAERANTAMTLDHDWALAETEFRRAIELNPSASTNHEKYAFFLVRVGRTQEALNEIAQAVALDPVSPSTLHAQGFIDDFARQYDRALAVTQTAQGLKINLPDLNFLRGNIAAGQGRYAEAIAAYQQAGGGPYALGHLGYAYARSGNRKMADRLIISLKQNLQQTGIGAYEIALVDAGLGDRDAALAWLETAYRNHDVGLVYLKVDPCLDALRGDPRFANLLRNMGMRP